MGRIKPHGRGACRGLGCKSFTIPRRRLPSRKTQQWAEGMFELAMHATCLPWGCFGYGPSRPTQAEVRHPWGPLHDGARALRATKQRLRLGFASSAPTHPLFYMLGIVTANTVK